MPFYSAGTYDFKCNDYADPTTIGRSRIIVTDCTLGTEVWNGTACVPGVPNTPPVAPTITGTSVEVAGMSGGSGVYTATDPDGDQIRYGVDWDNNGSEDEWFPGTGYVNSGIPQVGIHTWAAGGTYTIKVLTEDSKGSRSGWSAPSTITVVSPPLINGVTVTKGATDITVGYNKNFSTCVHMLNTSNVVLQGPTNLFCGNWRNWICWSRYSDRESNRSYGKCWSTSKTLPWE